MSPSGAGLPAFLIVGAAKSGTTWLTQALKGHSGIFLPDQELHFFSRSWERSLTWYQAQFRDSPKGAIVGERSNSYLYNERALWRIRETLGAPHLIAVLRNPVERAYSDYCMHFARGSLTQSPEEVLHPRHAGERPNLFLQQGRYGTLLKQVLATFERDRLKLVLFDDILTQPGAVLNDVVEFLGADPRALSLPDGAINPRATSRAPFWMRALSQATGGWQKRLPRPLSRVAKDLIRRVSEELDYPELTPDLRRALTLYYEAEMRTTEDLLGRSLEQWRLAEGPAQP